MSAQALSAFSASCESRADQAARQRHRPVVYYETIVRSRSPGYGLAAETASSRMGRWGYRLGDARRDAPLRFARALRARFSTFKLGLRPSQGSRCRPARGTRTQGPGKARSSRPPTWRGKRFARWHAPRPRGGIPTAPVLLDMYLCYGTRSSHRARAKPCGFRCREGWIGRETTSWLG